MYGIFEFQRRCFKLRPVRENSRWKFQFRRRSMNAFIKMQSAVISVRIWDMRSEQKNRGLNTDRDPMRDLLHLSFIMMNFNRQSRRGFVSRCWPRHPSVRRLLAQSGLLLAMGRHPDLGLMCHAKHRAAMWRATLPTTLCTSTFTCAAALIDARLYINTQSRENSSCASPTENFRYNRPTFSPP